MIPDHELTSSQYDQVKVSVRCSDSACQTITSSVACSYRQCGFTSPKKMIDALSLCNKGPKRHGKKLEQNLGLKVEEGKQPM